MALVVSLASQRSTGLSQEDEVGMKWRSSQELLMAMSLHALRDDRAVKKIHELADEARELAARQVVRPKRVSAGPQIREQLPLIFI